MRHLVLGLISFLAASGAAAREVRVAIMTDCKGAFGAHYENDIGGAQAAFMTMTQATTQSIAADEFRGVVACGGFSYGDVLGAGEASRTLTLFAPVSGVVIQKDVVLGQSFEAGASLGLGLRQVLQKRAR